MATLPENSKYRDVVEAYLQNRLPTEGIHSSFQDLACDPEVESRPPPPVYSKTEPDHPTSLLSNEQEGGQVDNDFASGLFIEQLYADADVETQHFREATIAYEKAAAAADPKYKATIDWDHVHTWEEVLDVIDKAAASYDEPSGVWGKVRKSFRSVGNNHKVFAAWMNLLPTQSQYASVVCGGLKVIFGAASRLKSLREEAYKALTQIPPFLERTGATLKIFHASVQLHKCSSALYIAILATLEHILQYYKTSSAKRILKAAFKQDEYESQLDEKIKLMDSQSRTFKELADQCSYETQMSTLGEVRALRSQGRASHRSVTQSIVHSRSEANLQHQVLNKSVQNLQTEFAIQKAESNALRVELKKVLKEFHRSNGRIDMRTNDIRRPLCPESNRVAAVSALASKRVHMVERILAILDCDVELLPQDVERNLRDVWTLPKSAQDRAVSLMESQRLHNWLTSTEPSAIFVNGNHDASARNSPISYVCSKLIDSICPWADTNSKTSSIIGLAFFCGQHLDFEDPARGPTGMMRNLILQLVMNYRAFSLTTLRQLLEIDSSEMQALCTAFSILIEQLPRRYMVLCVMDGITFYEDSPTESEVAVEAMKSLLETMESCRLKGCRFKLLATSPGISRELHQEFEEDEIIWLSKRIDPHGGLTPAKWEASGGMYMAECLNNPSSD